jgi:hypothetical protein
MEGTEVTGRKGIRRKQLQDYLMQKRGHWILKAEALYCTLWRTRFEEAMDPS